MQLVLVPSDQSTDLKEIYEKAFSEATELYILTAYLTAWDFHETLNPECNKFRLIVGTDFGITRKKALQAALAWLPNNQKCNFLAADSTSGFHPKAAFWKDKEGEHHCLIGSSNQTNAAFNSNHEANVLLNITPQEFEQASEWIQDIERNCSQVNEYWIDQYEESIPKSKEKPQSNHRKNRLRAHEIQVPSNFEIERLNRKKQMKAYTKIRGTFMTLVEECASGQLSNIDFYQDFLELWTKSHHVFFQSDGWKRQGKNSNFSKACDSLMKVRGSKISNIDDVVKVELDRLEEMKIPTRKSLFTELLCKEFPAYFPVWNTPIEAYLKSHGLNFPRASSFGSKYIHMAREMRKIVNQKSLPVKDLAELDLLIGLQEGWN